MLCVHKKGDRHVNEVRKRKKLSDDFFPLSLFFIVMLKEGPK